jgi:hypothetical protein
MTQIWHNGIWYNEYQNIIYKSWPSFESELAEPIFIKKKKELAEPTAIT